VITAVLCNISELLQLFCFPFRGVWEKHRESSSRESRRDRSSCENLGMLWSLIR